MLLMTVLAAAGCGSSSTSADSLPPTSVGVFTTTDVVVGSGATATTGSRVSVNYAAWLYDTAKPLGKGTQIDPGPGPLIFTVGAGQYVKGFEQGVIGMRAGGQRRVIVPPELAYGANPPSGVPVNATLVFDLTLNSVS